jgi:hypothetical protein
VAKQYVVKRKRFRKVIKGVSKEAFAVSAVGAWGKPKEAAVRFDGLSLSD